MDGIHNYRYPHADLHPLPPNVYFKMGIMILVTGLLLLAVFQDWRIFSITLLYSIILFCLSVVTQVQRTIQTSHWRDVEVQESDDEAEAEQDVPLNARSQEEFSQKDQ